MSQSKTLAQVHSGLEVILNWPGAGFVQGRSRGTVTAVDGDRVEVRTGFSPPPPPGSEMSLHVPHTDGRIPPLFLEVIECSANTLILIKKSIRSGAWAIGHWPDDINVLGSI